MTSVVQAVPAPELSPDPLDELRARLSDPGTAEALHQLLDHADLLAVLVVGLDGMLKRGETLTDSLAQTLDDLRRPDGSSLDIDELVRAGQRLAGSGPKILKTFETLADSPLAEPQFLQTAGRIAGAVIQCAEDADRDRTTVTGIRGLLRLLKDRDIGRALGFFAAIARAVGRDLDQSSNRHLLQPDSQPRRRLEPATSSPDGKH